MEVGGAKLGKKLTKHSKVLWEMIPKSARSIYLRPVQAETEVSDAGHISWFEPPIAEPPKPRKKRARRALQAWNEECLSTAMKCSGKT